MRKGIYLGEKSPSWGKNKYGITKEKLIEFYFVEKMSMNMIGEFYKCHHAVIQYYFKKFGLSARNRSEMTKIRFNRPGAIKPDFRGENNPNYRHGEYSGERIYRKMVENDVCELCGNTEGQIDRHHKDGNHFNNSKNNLMVICAKCHSSLHKFAYWRKKKQI